MVADTGVGLRLQVAVAESKYVIQGRKAGAGDARETYRAASRNGILGNLASDFERVRAGKGDRK